MILIRESVVYHFTCEIEEVNCSSAQHTVSRYQLFAAVCSLRYDCNVN